MSIKINGDTIHCQTDKTLSIETECQPKNEVEWSVNNVKLSDLGVFHKDMVDEILDAYFVSNPIKVKGKQYARPFIIKKTIKGTARIEKITQSEKNLTNDWTASFTGIGELDIV